MAINDPLGDMLTRIRNAQMRGKSVVSTPGSMLRQRVLDVLKEEGYIRGYSTTERPGFPTEISIELKYSDGEPVIGPAPADPMAAQAETLARIGMPRAIVMRHATPQFAHVFSGDGYSSGYYSYMWSEVMDADAFGAFEEAGDIFDPTVAKRLHDDIYSSGGSREPEEAYIAFRGRKPEADALLRRRGLLDTPEAA